ncbi:hypothetical protein HanXRQr2_Chr12g0528001 [Helianthus annuus]|uniref:Uncharacterized protein n=1 Tax=Helianthus annuus TaxID=4232 RepID=A0A9K3HEK4_HELAN|nr:hypothetical protein HanXRQr2_Chr12g0528001 [Helianthus annuus]
MDVRYRFRMVPILVAKCSALCQCQCRYQFSTCLGTRSVLVYQKYRHRISEKTGTESINIVYQMLIIYELVTIDLN